MISKPLRYNSDDSSRQFVLLTGATGLLGRYLLKDLLLAGQDVAVLVRSSRNFSASERVERLMQTWEQRLEQELPRPVVLEGDLTRPQLGLDAQDLNWLSSNCRSILHNAASLSFVTADRESEPWLTNLRGTQTLHDVAEKVGIRDFYHVSTAYVCGRRQDRILESDLNVGQELSNDYELSKIQAEEFLRDSTAIENLTVFRPSIIVGDSETGFTTTFHGFYAALRLAHTIRQMVDPGMLEGERINVRINLNGDERKNLVPVDWVSAVMAHIVATPELAGETYHLTSDTPISSRAIHEVIEAACDLRGTTQMIGAEVTLEQPSDIERLFYDSMQVYDAYWRNDPEFDSRNVLRIASHLPCPVIDQDRLLLLARTAISQNFRWNDRVTTKFSIDHQV